MAGPEPASAAGIFPCSSPIGAARPLYSELTIKGVFHHTPHYVETALNLLASGQVPADIFISGERPLAEVTDALELMGKQQGIKYAIVPPGV